MLKKTTIARAEIGNDYYIKRGRSIEFLGTLTAKEKRPRGLLVRFERDGEVTYNGNAGYATAILRKVETR